MISILDCDHAQMEKLNRILKIMFEYFFDAEKQSKRIKDDIYAIVFPAPFLKTGKKKCVATVRELYSWIIDDGLHELTTLHQYIVYWIIEFCENEENAYEDNCLQLNIKGEESKLFKDLDYEQNNTSEVFAPCFAGFDPIDIDIWILRGMFNSNLKLNKKIIDEQSIAVVPGKRAGDIPVNDSDVEEDYIWFCFAKFTKTCIAIQKLINSDLFEDALILTRSNYETFIHAKAVINSPGAIDHLVEFKLGLENGKYQRTRQKGRGGYRIIADSTDTTRTFQYTDRIWKIAELAYESNSYSRVYQYLCDLTHCDIDTIGYYQEGSRYSYKGSSKKALLNTLLWNVYMNNKFYEVLIDGEMFEINLDENKVANAIIEDSLTLKEIFDMQIFKVQTYITAIEDEEMKKELNNYVDDLNTLKDDLVG
ncbi:MAG TPA: DUF5677 domain-containing protein [Syntrophomonadaceae bacterium]|nr:DUF5677 domain-containing protein [Syntrophomonadaceae bacterium]